MDTPPARTKAGLKTAATRGAVWTAVETSARLLLRVAVLAILARTLTPSDFGIFAAASVLLEFARPFAVFAIDHALVQRNVLQAATASTAFTVVAAASLLVSVLLAGSAPLAAAAFDSLPLRVVIPVLAATLWVHAVTQLLVSMLKRGLAFRTLSAIEVASTTIGSGGLAVALALLGFEYWALVLGYVVEVLIRFLLCGAIVVWRYRPPWGAPTREEARALLKYGSGLTLSQVFSFAALQGDYFVVGTFLGTAPLGIYSRAYQVISIPPGVLATVSAKVLFPVLARIQTDRVAVQETTIASLQLASSLAVPTSALLLLLAPETVHVLLGAQWGSAVLPLQIMSAGVFLRTGISLSGSVALASARVYPLAIRQFMYALAVVLGSILAVRWGIAAVSASTVLAMVCFFVLMESLVVEATGIRAGRLARAQLPGVVAGAATLAPTSIAVWALRAQGFPPVAVLGAGLAVGAIALGLGVVAAPRWLLGEAASQVLLPVLRRKQ